MVLPIHLRNIPPGAYRFLADYYADLAEKLRRRADAYEHGDGDFASLHQQIGPSRKTADMVRAHIINGMSKAEAYEAVRQITGETIETIRSDYRHKYHSQEREDRNRARVLKYQMEGFGPKAVATITGLPYSFVDRTMRDAR